MKPFQNKNNPWFQEARLIYQDGGAETASEEAETAAEARERVLGEARRDRAGVAMEATIEKGKLDDYAIMRLEDVKTVMEEREAAFRESIYSTDGLISKTLTMGEGPKAAIREQTARHYHQFMQNVGIQCHREMIRLDRKLEGKEAEEKFDLLATLAKNVLENYDAMVQDMIEQAGSLEGVENVIDTKRELDQFNRNGLELIEKFKLKPRFFRDAIKENVTELSPDLDYMEKNVCSDSARIIQKINETEPLVEKDYDTLLGYIHTYYDTEFDTNETTSNLEKQVRQIEDAGALAAIHLMDSGQRYELATRLVETKSDEEASKGIRFLMNANFLQIDQGEHLLSKLPEKYRLQDHELEKIRETRRVLEEVRKACADAVGKIPMAGNYMMEHVTASNGLLYEIVFRFAALGVVLPFAFNITHPEDWTDIMTNPFWMASVGVAGVTADHVTGGIGQGLVSKGLTSAVTEHEPGEEVVDERNWEGLGELLGNNPQTTRYLQNTFGDKTVLERIHNYVSSTPKPNEPPRPWGDDSTKYEFKFDQFDDLEPVELDGRTESSTEEIITRIYRYLIQEMGCSRVSGEAKAGPEKGGESMLEVIQLSHEKRFPSTIE